MVQRRLLYLDANHLTAFFWQAGAPREEAHFRPDDEGMAAFFAYVRKHGGSLFFLLVDLAEEGFRIETVPRVQGADRKALLARKLEQHFYGSPLATATSLGRENTGRRDELVLFAALTHPQLVAPWLAILRSAEAALAGIYSVPLLGSALLAELRPAPARCLLVTVTRGGIRQSFYEGRQVRFSRLTPFSTTDPPETGAACAAEAAKTHRYLLGQRLVAPATPLAAIVLAHPDHVATFRAACRNDEGLHFQVVDLHALARDCRLGSLPGDSRSETLFLHLLIRRTPREQFAKPADRRYFRHGQARLALKSAGAVVLSGCLLFAGVQLDEAFGLRERTAPARAEAAAAAEKYAAIRASFPPMPTSMEKLREVIGRYELLERGSAPLEPLYLAVSRGLQDSPQVDIARLDWRLRSDPDEGKQKQDAARRPARAGDPAAPDAIHAIAVIHGMLPLSTAGDPRGQLAAINGFAAALRADASLTVSILSLPFDIGSGKPLKGGSDGAPGAGQPRFVVQISRKL